jgi:uncharacterized protein (DUF3084 family)
MAKKGTTTPKKEKNLQSMQEEILLLEDQVKDLLDRIKLVEEENLKLKENKESVVPKAEILAGLAIRNDILSKSKNLNGDWSCQRPEMLSRRGLNIIWDSRWTVIAEERLSTLYKG